MKRQIQVGSVLVGGDAPVSIQSMLNTKTTDVAGSLAQIRALKAAGCQIARLAVPDMEAAKGFRDIAAESPLPLVADIHFDYRLAIAAAEGGASKIRINPGNIGGKERVKAVVDVCKEKHIPIRIGVNGGSLEKEILAKYGHPTAEALVESALGHVALLEEQGVPTHFVRELSDRETLVKKVTIVPLEVIVRNISAGSFAKRYGVEEGIVFDAPTIEFSYKNDSLGDPLINSYHALALKLATAKELEQIKALAFRVNDLLKGIMKGIGIDLVDFKLEFGRLPDGSIVLADEISPDTCRLWDETTHEKLDKDRFRRDLGNVEGAYQEILRRMLGA